MPLALSPLSRRRQLSLALVMLFAALIALVRYLHWDDRTLLWLKEQQMPAAERAASIWLPGYSASIEGKPLAGLEDDEASDLAYSPLTGTLFTVTGKLPMLVELSRTGEVLRRIALRGFTNPEGVAVLENGMIALTDERQRNLSIFELDPLTRELDLADAKPFDLGFPDAGNKGFEGIAWDPAQQRLLLGKEREPTAMFSLGSDGQRLLERELRPLPSYGLGMRSFTYKGHRLVGHSGGVAGYRSTMMFDPASRTGIVMLWNSDANLPFRFQAEFFDRVYRQPFTDFLELKSPAGDLAETSLAD